VHADDLGGIADRTRFEHALQIGQPALFLAQPCQRRTGERVVAAPAAEAAETLQPACLAAAMFAGAAAVRTRPPGRRLLDEGDALGRMRDADNPFP
jgi:hypothetical protein